MKGKLRAAAASRFPRIAIFVICALFFTVVQSPDHAQEVRTDEPAPEAVIESGTFHSVAPGSESIEYSDEFGPGTGIVNVF